MIELIEKMHGKFKIHDVVSGLSNEMKRKHLDLRLNMIKEEVSELEDALNEEDSEEFVDALIDIMVFTLGTLDLVKVDTNKAFSAVINANIDKEVGIKEGRPNPYGFPDLVKPEGWVAPSHEGNHGELPEIFGDQ